jgi:hypothetical protein
MVDRQVIEWDKDDIDALKFMKVDVLALGMLTCTSARGFRSGRCLACRPYGSSHRCEDLPPGWSPDRQVIEWDKDDIDALKFMKVDVLALGMLTCMKKGGFSRGSIDICARLSIWKVPSVSALRIIA